MNRFLRPSGLVLIIGVIVILIVIGILVLFQGNKVNITKDTVTPRKSQSGALVDKQNNLVADVATTSEIDGYKVELKNKTDLIKIIASWHLYGIKIGGDIKKTAGFKPITTVKVILTDKPQPYYLLGNKNNKLAATAGYDFEGANFLVKVNLTKDGLLEPNSYFEEEALRTVFNFTHPWDIKTGEQKQIDAFNAFLKEKNAKKLTFFEVIKK